MKLQVPGVVAGSEPAAAPPSQAPFLQRHEFLRDSAIVFASTMAVNIVNYGIHFVLSRRLGVQEYGEFASLMSVMAIVGIPSGFIVMVVAKFAAEFHALDELSRIRVLSQRALLFGSSLGVVFFVPAVLAQQQIAGYLHLTDPTSVVAMALVLGLSCTVPVMWAVLQGAQDFSRLAISSTIEAVAKLVLGVGMTFLGFRVAGVFFGYAIAIVLTMVVTLPFVRRHWAPGKVGLKIDAKRLLYATGGVIVGTSAITILGYIDVPMVKHFFDATDAGLYGAVAVCGKILFFLVGFVPTLVLPKAARDSLHGRPAGRVLLQGLALTALLAGCGLALFLFVPTLVVRVTYGVAFIPAAPYIFAYGLAMTLLAATAVVVNYKIGLHHFAFVGPLVLVTVAEPVAIQFFHATLWNVIAILIIGNAAALGSCLLADLIVSALHRPRESSRPLS